MTWTNTTRGRALDLLDPKPDDIDIGEIALALSQQCRYAGCVRRFYSVAEHSVLIAQHLLRTHGSATLALGGLLHDAAEAYTGDITFPVQQVLWGASPAARDAYRAMQARLDVLIADAARLAPAWLHHELVKQADLAILHDERAALLVPADRPWDIEHLAPLGVQIRCLRPALAEEAWIDLNDELQALRGPL